MAQCNDDPKTIIVPPAYPSSGGLPPGGTTGQVLTKRSDADGDVVWASGGGGTPVVIDPALSTTSRNPVENRVITNALNGKASQADLTALTTVVNGKADAADLGNYVEKETGKGLSANDYTDADKAKLDALEAYEVVPVSEVELWFAA